MNTITAYSFKEIHWIRNILPLPVEKKKTLLIKWRLEADLFYSDRVQEIPFIWNIDKLHNCYNYIIWFLN